VETWIPSPPSMRRPRPTVPWHFVRPTKASNDVRRYLRENFEAETDVACRFGEPIAAGNGAAVEWWAWWVEDGQRLSMAGVSVFRFNEDGRVVDHRDYWNQTTARIDPYEGW
jgi:ketosteroid isomerase-like protein